MEVKEGQIWREVDPRFARFVEVIGVRDEFRGRPMSATIVTIVSENGMWVRPRRSREVDARLDRFNGKRGGYEFYSDGESLTATLQRLGQEFDNE